MQIRLADSGLGSSCSTRGRQRDVLEGFVVARIEPIEARDLPEVGLFLHRHLNSRVPANVWASATKVPWQVDLPNHGFLARTEEGIVGAYLAYYSRRPVGDRMMDVCNLGAWCVLEEHRFAGLRLFSAVTRQPGWQFTDLSPSGNVVALNRKMGFADLDTTTAVLVNQPLGTRGVHVTAERTRLESELTGPTKQIFLDHRDAAAAIQILVRVGSETCLVVARRDRRKRVSGFASILYVSNPELYRRHAAAVGRYLLARHAIPFTLAELRVTGGRPMGTVAVRAGRPKMYRGASMTAADVDYLYSEMTCLPW